MDGGCELGSHAPPHGEPLPGTDRERPAGRREREGDVSLVVMVVVNQSATKMVKAAGYQVGLLGADPKQFD